MPGCHLVAAEVVAVFSKRFTSIGRSLEQIGVSATTAQLPFHPRLESLVLSERRPRLDISRLYVAGSLLHPSEAKTRNSSPSGIHIESHRSDRRTESQSARKGGNISSAGGTIIYRRGRGGTQREDRGSTTGRRDRGKKFGEDEGSGQASCESCVSADCT